MLCMIRMRKVDVIPSFKYMREGYDIRIQKLKKTEGDVQGLVNMLVEKRNRVQHILNMCELTQDKTILLSDVALAMIIDDLRLRLGLKKGEKIEAA